MTEPVVAELSRAKRALYEARLRGRQQEAPIAPRARTGDAPLSHAQERLWFVDRMFPESTVFTLVADLRLPGALDAGVLERALGEIVRRHEVLRTTFQEVNGVPVQVVAPFTGFSLPLEDLSALPPGEREAQVQARIARERAHVFDLSAGPLLRASLLRLDAGDHVLLLATHHIIGDAWSQGVLQRELSLLYDAYRAGWDSPLPPLPVQYADYAAWQRSQPPAAEERHLAYWRRKLGGAPELLELPTDRPRTPVPSFRGAQVPVQAPPGVVDRLRALANAQGATLHMVLLGAFQVLLARYAGTEDVSVGIAVAGRSRREVEGLIGIFVNTLVLRTDLSGDPTFRAVVDRARETALDAYQHQEVPFERVVAEVRPHRSLSHAALYQVLFQLDDAAGAGEPVPASGDAPAPASAAASVGELGPESSTGEPQGSTQVDLTLNLRAARGLSGSLEYATDLFDEGTARRMAGHLERLLALLAADPDVRIGEVPLLDEAERAVVLEAWNRTAADDPVDTCVHEQFEAQGARTPEALAVVDGDEALTYAELDARANRLAHHLRGRGVGAEVRVGVLVERSPGFVAAVLGVLKAGGAYVPLDPAYPAERLRYVLEDSGARVLVTAGGAEAALGGEGVNRLSVVDLDGDAEAIAGEPETPPTSGVRPPNLAYVIYTSGSTGTPKGVEVTHEALLNLVHWHREAFAVTEADRATQLAGLGFDASVWELWPYLASGAEVHLVADEETRTSPAALQSFLLDRRITVAFAPTPVAEALLALAWPSEAPLRLLLAGGDALVGRPRAELPFALVNNYGPTENTVVATSGVVSAGEGSGRAPAIGRPIRNVRTYVLDRRLEPVPVGVPGELCVGGAQVARGYLGRAALTAESFVPDPFHGPGARMYRTGDRVRWLASGELEFLGRLDRQVKVRGFRIELGEIEGVLRRSEGVADCVVLAREDVPGDKRLVAYVVGDVDAGVLREHLRRALPEYMVPAAYVSLERLPLTPGGKLDRKALPAPEGDAYARGSYEPPLGEVEAALAELWSELLGVERVGRWDHFFELGGHSLMAIRLIERMRRVGLHMEVQALFTTPVLADLARTVGGESTEEEVPANRIPEGAESLTPEMLPLVELSQPEIDRIVGGVPGGAANVQDIYPLAPLQEGIHFHHLLSEEGDPYLLSMVVAFDTRADLDQYLAALQKVIDRHDILRTAVAWEGLREPVQVVWRQAPLPVEEVVLDAGAEDAAAQLWRRYDPRHYRMDVGRAPMLQACIAEDRARGGWLLLLLTHHLTSDHESLEVLREEISAHQLGRASELPAPLPFRSYVARSRLGVGREEHERFFRELLGDVEEPTAPYGLLDVRGEGRGIGEAWLRVAGDLGGRLRRRARALGVSAASLCHLAWAQVLARVSGRQDVVFGTLLFGRMQGGEGAHRVMGPFINTLPVRIGVGEEGAEAAVRRTHAVLAELLRHEHASLSLAQRCSGVAAPAPLFTSLLNYRYSGRATNSQEEAGQPRKPMRGIRAEERTNYPVTLSVDDFGEEFSLAAQVAAPADAMQVCRMMYTALERLVEALELSPARAIGSVDVLPEADRLQVVEEWNRTDAKYPVDACVHEIFEDWAARTSDAVGVRFGEESLTYGELNARANRLAHHLAGVGVRAETRVALCLERGPEMVVSVLAVLKAGGAYVPLDPAYPPDRLAFMLADAAVPVLVTQTSLRATLSAGDGIAVVSVDGDGDSIAAHSDENPDCGVSSDHLAYVIYTSGSTGTPKGVLVQHGSLANLLASTRDTFGIVEGDLMPAMASYAFDIWLFEALLPLTSGAAVRLVERERVMDVPALVAEIADATLVHAVPALMRQIVHVERETPRLARLRRAFVGGDRVAADLLAEMRDALPNAETHVLYGPTEGTILASTYPVPEDGIVVGHPIGRPLGNVRLYVCDPLGSPQPAGVAGELLIGGAGVARGYLDRFAMTAERFVPDPFSVEGGARLYRTGDRAQWRADGTLEFLGRVDAQVKVRGFRIEPGEIEAALRSHESIADCVVVAREDVPGETRLVAYVVGGVEADVLREHLRRSLPEYMLPSAFVFLEALPLTPNGKLDRRALPAPEYAAGADRYVAPRTPTEEVLAGIWAELLRLERVGREDNFFELGGHSLLATQLVSRVREAFRTELPLRAVFEAPTLAELVNRVESLRAEEAADAEAPPLVPVPRDGSPLPLSFAQQRLWFIEQLEPGTTAYHMPSVQRLRGPLDVSAMERALGDIVRRHEALRTTFGESEGVPFQVVHPAGETRLEVTDLSGLPPAEREAEAGRLAQEEAQRLFDLRAGPLFRTKLLRLADDDHVLVMAMHHVVSDGWSMGVLFGELGTLYEVFSRGEPSPLPELPLQYADFAVWQRTWLSGEVLERQIDWWKERLEGAPPILELPTDHPRTATPGSRTARVFGTMSPETADGVRALARREGATLYMVLLAALDLLLARWSGQDDVVVGSPIAGRTQVETEGLIGFFVNTLALRTDLSGNPSFASLVGRVREGTLGAYQHQSVPFERLVDELKVERSLSHSPLFQVIFSLVADGGSVGAGGTGGRGGGGGQRPMGGLAVEPFGAGAGAAKYDLDVVAIEQQGGLGVGFTYREELWDASTIERVAAAYALLLAAAVADPGRPALALPLVSQAERESLLAGPGGPFRDDPVGLHAHDLLALGEGATPGFPRATVDALFAQAATAAPESVALAWDGGRMTYAELDGRANRLAHHLRRAGVIAGTRVGVCLERGPEMVVATLAALKAGGAYVPLDPSYPAERLAFMLAETAVPVLVTESSLADRLPPHAARTVRVDTDAAAIAVEPSDAPAIAVNPDAAAYLMYTSGSTGRPKGVEVPHRAIVRLVRGQDYLSIDPSDVFLQLAPATFDAATLELWGPLLNGARLAIHPAGQPSVESIGQALAEHGVTILWLTAGLFHLVVDERIEVLRGVRQLVAGGDVLSVPHVRRVRAELPETALINGYGPTENTTFTCCHRVGEAPREGASIPIGRPIAGSYVRVLDAGMQPVPVGMPGELYAGGAGLALGYLNQPRLTAEKFVADPYLPGERLYRTGDRVRWVEVRECESAKVRESDGDDGSREVDSALALSHSRTFALEFLGRVDTQVKIRGFRVEPGEIEAALRAWPGVREAAVVVREDEAGDRRLVAYVAGEVAVDEVREHLRGRLPEHMVPAAFVVLEQLPLTPNGKLDRKALPAPEYTAGADRYVAPRTPVEEVLAGIWAEVLRLERVGVEESFFDLGGHSLLATRVVSRIREVLAVELPLRTLFEGPTVAELAGRVEEIRRAGDSAALPPLAPVVREAPLPLSFAQERLWFLHQMDPEDAGYNMPFPRRLRGGLDAGALERALSALTERHESLRTTFRPVEQGAVQVIHPATPAHLPMVDLTGLDPQAREDEVRRLAREDAERPFDLERGPLLRATLLRLADEEHVLLLAMHHIVSDGWSMGVLFRELFTLYQSPASPLPPLAVQYADFAVWQRGWLQGDVLRRQLDWWGERLGGAPPALELPTDRPRPAVASARGESLAFRIPAEVTRGLRALARREGATLYMVTHAALDLLLARWSGQEDLVVGSPIAGRTQVGTEGLIGFFVNTLALRVDLSGDPTFTELVRRVRETALGAYAHQELPFERLVEEVAPDRGLSHTPLFQVMFALQNAVENVDSGRGAAPAGVRPEPFGGEIRTVRFDLELDLHEVGEELAGSLRFRTDLFDAATMERFAAQYRAVLAAAVTVPEEPLSCLAILPSEEARTLFVYGSGPARDDEGDEPVHRLFAAQAARTPVAPALLSAGESLTYAELDGRAERLARRLRGRAVPGSPVAVLLERGPQAVVALLAIWKMGGVYLPLDPAHPVERLSFFLRDSGAKLVISNPTLAGALLEREADVLLLDPSAADDIVGEALQPFGDGDSDDLAYLIYTSGSTGTPKAVMVEHAQLTHTLLASLDTLGFARGDVVAALASTAFDISLLELITPLLAGGAVRVIPHEVARDPETLVEAVADVTVLHAVPALMRQVVEAARDGKTLPSLRLLLVGGDSVPPDLLEDMREVFPDARTVVLYGPTEAAIICAAYAVPTEGAVAGHPLGRPLPGVRLAVRGPRGELAPVGVPGEVWISGGGVARGYLDRPELNAEKFVSIEGERAYRTGDRARWRADGVLEFLGRADEQVKVRGFRIEPGEVEAVLRGQPGVREAVVLAREDVPGDRRLVAYVVSGAEADGVEVETDDGKEQVSEWETLFDDTYAQDEGEADPTLLLTGWNSSYTGEPIPRDEMRAWADHTAERILALGPERVLEIGAGTGLVLFRVAPHTRAYHATDFSGVALDHIRRHSAELPQVTLSQGEADELAEFAGAEFDTVILNSVAQYFPDVEYLLRMLEGAAAAMRPGGRIFVGDVRSLPLAGAFHASVELSRAPDDLPTERLEARVRRGVSEEQELLVDPALFEALRARMPRLGRVEVQVKRGEYDNEVSRFRYDVVLHLDAAAPAAAPVVRQWSGEDAAALRALAADAGQALLVHGVPDARVREHVRALELISGARGSANAGEVRTLAGAGAGDGVRPEALFALAGALARRIEVRPGAAGTLDVLFHPAGDVARFPVAVDAERPWESYANDPQWGRRMRALVPALREAARARLPEYMVPAAFVVLEAFPVTANGKVDRAALPVPDTLGSREGTYVAPRTPAEEGMAGIWADVLGVERVGAEDNFFELGGHSLLATQLVSRVREAFRTELPLRAVFERPVLSELAAEIDRLRGSGEAAGETAIAPAAREGDLPVTFAQERLWFVDALDPGSPVYAIPFTYRITGRLDADALRRALTELVRRHEPLRTALPAVDGVPVQRIAPPPPELDLPVADLRPLPEDERRAEAGRLAAEAARHRFDLARGPLFRASLVHVAEDEHDLLLNLHHAVGDGWSVGVLKEELSALYGAFSRGEASPLPEPALQYADYAVWQREQLSGEALERQLAYWRTALEGAPALLELPTDRPRPPVESHRGAVEGLVVAPGLAAEVNALARREGATLFMVLLAALDVVLGRLAGQEDVVVGTPIAGRTRAETDRMVGLFLNSLALRTDLSGDPSFRELLGRVRETTLGAYAHQDLPFERVLEEVRPERSLAHAPVFQVMLNLVNFQEGAFRAEGLEVAEGGTGGGELDSKFDLTLYVGERDGRIVVTLVYAADLFDAPRMRALLAQLEGVLRQAATAPETRVRALSLSTEAAKAVLPDPAEPLDDTWRGAVHEIFAARAAESPEALAIEDPRERWTYAELDAATDRIARALAGAGVGPGDVVAITGHRSAALVRALVGTMKSGAAFLVLDPAYPAARLADYIRIAKPAAHLHISAAGDLPGEATALLAETTRTMFVLHPRGGGGAEEVDGLPSSGEPLAVGIGPDTLAYLSFTSGTTGMPKAVMGRHSSLTHFTPWLAAEFGLEAIDRFSLLSGLAHDPLHRDVFTPLQLGAAIVAPEADEIGTPGYLARWMHEAGVTVAHLTPAMGQLLADTSDDDERIDSLRRAFFVGDVLRRADVQRLASLAPNLTVVNYYGSTETQRAVSYHVVDLAAEQKEIIPLGRGIPGVQLLVRNAAGEVAGVGEVGEIWLRSPHVAAGYLGDAELSASRFVANPWTGQGTDRLYRTGDLGRYRPDGEVEPLGRADQQVKVRGFRVELGEVESALAAHAAVKEAAVIARETAGGDRRLVAYWVPAEESGQADAASLRLHLKGLLPEYMVPSAYVRMDRLPLTANAKLDRRALPEPEAAATDARPAAPRTPTEEILAQFWAELLRVESVGVDDDFFALGGHSLLATRLLSRVQNTLGVVLPLRSVFEGPTVGELAERVDAQRQGGAHVLPLVRVDRDRPLPLSFAQERLWFLDRLEGGSAAYNLPAALRLTGALDERALEQVLGEIIRRHESLRTTFAEVDGVAVQVIVPFEGFALPVVDLSALGETEREAEARRRAGEDAAHPFDLAEGPLFRATLLRMAEEEHVLLLCLHHIVSDGWSSGVLHRELNALYAAFSRGEGSPLPPLPVQYADFAVWQREQLRGDALGRQIGYWKERLAGAPALLELPTDRPRPPVQSHRGARGMFDLPLELLDGLQALGRGEGATLYMVMLGAFQVLLGKYAGSEDVVVGSPIAGRTRREVEELIGLFANTLVLRTDLSGDPSFRELLGRVREGTLGAYEHQDIPFERLVAELQPERSMAHSPLFQVMFTLQNADRSGAGLTGLRMAGVAAEMETTRFDLALTAIPHEGGVHCALEYSTALFDRSTVQRMLGHLQRVLEQVVADADLRLSQLVLLDPAERALVLDAWNATDAEFPADACIHELFEAQAERTPDAVAVVFEDRSLTYAELNAHANRLAHHLRMQGVGPDVRVGICVERGLEMVIGLLGVLKAGGAYVPLDPGQPAERLAYMLADSAPAVVLTQPSLRDRVETADVPLIDLEGGEWATCPEIDPERAELTAGHLAYVIYTSGSTGRPKGVAVPHRGVVNLLRSIRDTVGMEPADRLLAITTYAFDISVLEIFLPLLHGARTIVLSRERAADPSALADAVRAYAPTVMQATPATWRMLVQSGWDGASQMRALSGGEALPADLASALRDRVGALWNVYGPTETTIWSTSEAVRGDAAGSVVPVGRPLANTRVYVLAEGGEPVPVGVAGELYIGGAGVVRGYLGRPDQTAERFVADPFASEPGARLYRTGDLARWRPDGTLEFIGRTDFQVKVRGFRIELGEIEARLAEHPDVREAVVMAREDAPGDVRLVAYVVGDADAESMRAHLSAALPDYMVPAAYVRLEALPLTPNGKLDRKALPAPEGSAYASREYEAPVGKIEEGLAGIWTELLRVERVGRNDHFFELGGHSLLALQVVSRVRQAMQVDLALAAVFEKPVLSTLAEWILKQRLARFDPETLARLAQRVREPGAETVPAREEPE